MNKLIQTIALACFSLSASELKPVPVITGDPNTTSRTVQYHETDIVPIQTEIRFTTLIMLPATESILEVTCGDKEFWPVNWNANLAYIKPAKPGSKTNLNLIAASGNVYSFILTEISGNAAGHADLKVFVSPSDGSAIAAMNERPRFISADAIEPYRRAAEQAQLDAREKIAAAEKKAEAKKVELEAALPGSLRHDYLFQAAPKNPFHVTAIYHDGKFTYIEAAPSEAPAIYETKDGKPSLIQFELKGGLYVIPKILDAGYMRVGKAELKFHREN
jgi:type IV secretory pathway VirB9-like protein